MKYVSLMVVFLFFGSNAFTAETDRSAEIFEMLIPKAALTEAFMIGLQKNVKGERLDVLAHNSVKIRQIVAKEYLAQVIDNSVKFISSRLSASETESMLRFLKTDLGAKFIRVLMSAQYLKSISKEDRAALNRFAATADGKKFFSLIKPMMADFEQYSLAHSKQVTLALVKFLSAPENKPRKSI